MNEHEFEILKMEVQRLHLLIQQLQLELLQLKHPERYTPPANPAQPSLLHPWTSPTIGPGGWPIPTYGELTTTTTGAGPFLFGAAQQAQPEHTTLAPRQE